MSCSCKLFCCKLFLFNVFTEQINDDDDKQNSKGCRSLDVIRRSLNTSASVRPVGVHNFHLHTGSALNIADYIDYYQQHGEIKDSVSHADLPLCSAVVKI